MITINGLAPLVGTFALDAKDACSNLSMFIFYSEIYELNEISEINYKNTK